MNLLREKVALCKNNNVDDDKINDIDNKITQQIKETQRERLEKKT